MSKLTIGMTIMRDDYCSVAGCNLKHVSVSWILCEGRLWNDHISRVAVKCSSCNVVLLSSSAVVGSKAWGQIHHGLWWRPCCLGQVQQDACLWTRPHWWRGSEMWKWVDLSHEFALFFGDVHLGSEVCCDVKKNLFPTFSSLCFCFSWLYTIFTTWTVIVGWLLLAILLEVWDFTKQTCQWLVMPFGHPEKSIGVTVRGGRRGWLSLFFVACVVSDMPCQLHALSWCALNISVFTCRIPKPKLSELPLESIPDFSRLPKPAQSFIRSNVVRFGLESRCKFS